MRTRIFTLLVVTLMLTPRVFAQEFSNKGLLYRVFSEQEKAVELTGFKKKAKGELIIPEIVSYKGNKYAVAVIAEEAFRDCSEITNVEGNSIKLVKKYAFCGCNNLQKVSFSNQLQYVMENAFANCKMLTDISLGNNLYSLGRNCQNTERRGDRIRNLSDRHRCHFRLPRMRCLCQTGPMCHQGQGE